MKPGSAERRPSASSFRSNARQRLTQSSIKNKSAPKNNPNKLPANNKGNQVDILTVFPTEVEPFADHDKTKPTTISNLSKSPTFIKPSRGPIEVHIRCIFVRIGDIDTLNERYHAELLLEASWIEASLKTLPTQPFDPRLHWTPDLELVNGIGELQDDVSYSLQPDQQGSAVVTESHRLKGTLWERMELQHFPIDIQQLSLLITSSHTDYEMKFHKNEKKTSGVNRRVFSNEQEWHLFEHVDIEVSEETDEYFADGHSHPVVRCSCRAARKIGYFLWNSYFLIFLITSASFATFPIPLSSIQGRMQIACTLLLTSITFRWLSNKSIPTLSYLTAVDVYAIGSMFSLCLLNIYHAVIGYTNYYKSGNTTGATVSVPSIEVIDRWALVVFTILFFSYQIGNLIWVYVVPWRNRQSMFKKDAFHRLQIQSKSNRQSLALTVISS